MSNLESLRALSEALHAVDTDPSANLTQRQRDTVRRFAVRVAKWAKGETPNPRAGYLTRGQFARAAGVSINTLVSWHTSGALIPAEVDAVSGYRYYTVEQIPAAKHARQRAPRTSKPRA